MFIFLMVLYFFANTAARLLVRKLTVTTKLDPYSASLAVMAPTYIIGAKYGLTQLDQPMLQGVTPLLIALALLVGVIQVISGKISMITQKHIETAPYTVIRMIFVPTSVLISTVLLGESLSLMQLTGMLSILAGATIVSTGGKLPHIKHLGRYEILTLLNSVFLGAYIIFSSYLIDQTSLATLMVLFAGLEQLPLLTTVAKRPLMKPSSLDLKISLGIGLSSAIHIIAFWSAVAAIDNIALVSSLSAFRIVTIFIGSYIFLKEKSNLKQKLAGSALATAGLLLS